MAPHKYGSGGGGIGSGAGFGYGTGGKVGAQSSGIVMTSKKLKMEQIQADHELFLQAFESKCWLLHYPPVDMIKLQMALFNHVELLNVVNECLLLMLSACASQLARP